MWQVIDPTIADNFVHQFGQSEFLQSSDWQSLQEQFYSVDRLGYYSAGQLIAVTTLVYRPLVAGWGYYYSPRGPIINRQVVDNSIWQKLVSDLQKWSSRRRIVFWRIEPASQFNDFDFSRTGWRSSLAIQPAQTRILELNQTEEDLLAQMHHKTRYNIRLASRRGVQVESVGSAGFADFWQLLTITGQRDQFSLHSQDYYQAITKIPTVQLLLAKYDGQVLAGGLFAYWGSTAVYLHGASSDQRRHLMAPYLVQWQAIQLASQQGCQYYDFFGIDLQKWPGVTRFKQGFGGQVVNFPGTFDYPWSKFLYFIYQLARRWRRGLF